MERYILVTFSNGDKYRIPGSVIAESRATHYADRDSEEGKSKWGEIYKEEYDYTLGDDYELVDWAENNMDWSDVESVAELVMSGDVDFEDEWCNADKEIVIE